MRLALGTVQFGLAYGIANQAGQVTRPAAKSMLHFARQKGIDTLDTAIAYGESESCLGEIGTQGFKLVTKLPAVPDRQDDLNRWVHEQVAASFGRLGVDSVYGLLLHRPDQLLKTNGQLLFNALQELKESGLVKKIGISIYSPDELEALVSKYQLDLAQVPLNLIDRRIITSGWLQRLKHAGVEIHSRSAFLQGLLLMNRSDIPAKFETWKWLWDKWHDWLAQNSVTAVQACLAYPLSIPEIERVVIGADSAAQLEQILGAAHGGIPIELPDLRCDDVNLINPANWSRL